jgi:hypothetical protein
MKRPSLRHGTAGIIQVIWGRVKNISVNRNIGRRTDWTRQSGLLGAALGQLWVTDEGCGRRVLQAIVEGVVWTGRRATYFCCIAADRVAGFR